MTEKSGSPFPLTVDLEADGKHGGHVLFPHSRDDSAWGHLMLPIISVRHGDGPRILFTGGNHGDEYEAQVALMKLARGLEPRKIRGQVIIVPSLNLPAALAGTRVSPIDNGNLNRVFPGNPKGTMTERIACFVNDELLPRVDIVVDLHSGGKSLMFLPCGVIHMLEDKGKYESTLAALNNFGTLVGLVNTEHDPGGMLDTAAENMGKIFVSAELGGGGTLSPSTIAIADRAVANMLVHFEITRGHIERPDGAPRLMRSPDHGATVMAHDNGLFEPFVEIGSEVEPDMPVGQIHAMEDPTREPVVQKAEAAGLVICRRVPSRALRGDALVVLAEDLPG